MPVEHPEHTEELRRGLERLAALGLVRQGSEPDPSVIGAYRVIEKLGQGGIGTVSHSSANPCIAEWPSRW